MFPEVIVELTTGTTGALIKRLTSFEIEAAFISEPFCAPHLEALPVFEEELVLVTSRMAGGLSRPADLASSTLIAFGHGCSYRKRVEEWLATADVVADRVLEFASYQAMIACVAPALVLPWCRDRCFPICGQPRASANTTCRRGSR